MKKFSETQPELEREEDRFQLVPGDHFVITGFVMQNSRKYEKGIAKINGYEHVIVEELEETVVVKRWTTGVAIINQLDNMAKKIGIDAGQLKDGVRVAVITVDGPNGAYLSFADPEEAA